MRGGASLHEAEGMKRRQLEGRVCGTVDPPRLTTVTDGSLAAGSTGSAAAARQISSPIRQPTSADRAGKNTSSPIILTTRPPASRALDQAADSNWDRVQLWSRQLGSSAHPVEPSRSTD